MKLSRVQCDNRRLRLFQRNSEDVAHLFAGSLDNGAKKVSFIFYAVDRDTVVGLWTHGHVTFQHRLKLILGFGSGFT